MRLVHLGIALCFIVAWAAEAKATLSYATPGATYTQDFNSLGSSPINNPYTWSNNGTIEGWYLYRATTGGPPYNGTPVAVDFYEANDGTSTLGKFYSYGSVSSPSDRALGSLGAGTFAGVTSNFGQQAGWIAAGITNNTGGTLPQFTVGFNGEQWRDAGNDPNDVNVFQTMVFQYGFGDTFSAVVWSTPGGNFDWTSLVNTTIGAAVDGNSAGLAAGRGGTITNLTWTTGQTLWLRWIELNDQAFDHGLAIDDFSFSAGVAAVPEPTSFLFGGLVTGVIGIAVGCRKFLAKFRK